MGGSVPCGEGRALEPFPHTERVKGTEVALYKALFRFRRKCAFSRFSVFYGISNFPSFTEVIFTVFSVFHIRKTHPFLILNSSSNSRIRSRAQRVVTSMNSAIAFTLHRIFDGAGVIGLLHTGPALLRRGVFLALHQIPLGRALGARLFQQAMHEQKEALDFFGSLILTHIGLLKKSHLLSTFKNFFECLQCCRMQAINM